MRRYENWEPKKSIELVKEFIVCLDQLRSLSAAHHRKLVFFDSLMKDLEIHEAEDQRNPGGPKIHNSEAVTALARVEWAIKTIKDEKAGMDSLIEDTTRALEAVSIFGQCKGRFIGYNADIGASTAVSTPLN